MLVSMYVGCTVYVFMDVWMYGWKYVYVCIVYVGLTQCLHPPPHPCGSSCCPSVWTSSPEWYLRGLHQEYEVNRD